MRDRHERRVPIDKQARSLLNKGVLGRRVRVWGERNAAKAVERRVLSQHP